MNPILYNLMSSKFREGFVKLLGCKSMMRTTSWAEGARKGTFTTSTNLSSSNQGNAAEIQRLRNARLGVNDVKSVERAPLNAIKYATIVVEEKIESSEAPEATKSDCNSDSPQKRAANSEKNVNNSRGDSINSYVNKQKSNYRIDENVKIPIKPCNVDKCLSNEPLHDGIDSKSTDQDEDFSINIYNLLSAKESLV